MAENTSADTTITLTVGEWLRLARAAQGREPFLAALVLASLPCSACGKVPMPGQDSTVHGKETGGRRMHMRCWAKSTLSTRVAAILPD